MRKKLLRIYRQVCTVVTTVSGSRLSEMSRKIFFVQDILLALNKQHKNRFQKIKFFSKACKYAISGLFLKFLIVSARLFFTSEVRKQVRRKKKKKKK